MRLAQVGLGSGGGLPGENQFVPGRVRVLSSLQKRHARAATRDPLGRSL